MTTRRAQLALWFATLTLVACDDAVDPSQIAAPRFATGGGATPGFAPFATAPVAGTTPSTCGG